MGNGDQISIVNSAWIPCSVDYRLANPIVVGNLELVAELIEPTFRVWKEDLITHVFGAIDIERILQIPLAAEPCEDELAWMCEPSREFSVRSSYKLLHSLTYPATSYNLHNDYKPFYKQLWNTNLPSKIHIIVWCISKQYILKLIVG